MAGNDVFNSTVESLFKGMDSFLSTKTVVGEAIHIGDTIILPLVNVSFGVAAGAFSQDHKNNGGGGLGGKMTPSAVLVIHNGSIRMISVNNSNGIDKILDMVPDFVDKFTKKGDKTTDSEARDQAAKEMEDIIVDAVNPEE